MRVKQKDVPLDVRRRAAQHLESLRGTSLGFNVRDLYLGDDVCPVYRPDLKDPAYYEFQVLKATKDNPDERSDLLAGVAKANVLGAGGYRKAYSTSAYPSSGGGGASVQGFIMVSTGAHDFPIPHWSLDHPPVSVALEQGAAGDMKIAKVFKLDALSYVAEDKAGKEIPGVPPPPTLWTRGCPLKISRSLSRSTCASSAAPKAHRKLGWLM